MRWREDAYSREREREKDGVTWSAERGRSSERVGETGLISVGWAGEASRRPSRP